MWKYVKWLLLFAVVFFLGKAYGARKPQVIWKNCDTHLAEWKRRCGL